MPWLRGKAEEPIDPSIGAAEQQKNKADEDEIYETARGMSEDLMERLTTALERLAGTQQPATDRGAVLEDAAGSSVPSASVLFNLQALLGMFVYKAESELTFENWFFRNQPILEASITADVLRVQILLKCLGDCEYRRLRYRISPDLPESKSYADLVQILKSTFGSSKSLFRRRHDILSYRADPSTRPADVINLANIKGDEFEFKDLTLDQFKIFLSLIFASGPSFKNFRTVALKMLDEKPDIKIDKLREVVEQYTHRSEDAALDANSAAIRSEITPTDLVNHVQRAGSARPSKGGKQGTRRLRCWGCGEDHLRSSCPHAAAKCNLCHKKGHLAKICKSKKGNVSTNGVSCHVDSVDASKCRAYATVSVNAKPLRFWIDLGADVTVIGEDSWVMLGRPQLSEFEAKCTGVSGEPLDLRGCFNAEFILGSVTTVDVVVVVRRKKVTLLGGKLPYTLGLVSLSSVVEIAEVSTAPVETLKIKFPELFKEGLGRCTKVKVTLPIRAGVVPTHLPRSPFCHGQGDQRIGEARAGEDQVRAHAAALRTSRASIRSAARGTPPATAISAAGPASAAR